MTRLRSVFTAALAAMISAFSLCPAQAEEVDVELVLAVDVSGSMRNAELRLQRRGYVEALRSPQVHEAIARGDLGKVAITYLEWARDDLQKVIVPWTLIDGAASANAFADRLEAAGIENMRNTSISGAIETAMRMLDDNPHDGLRQVIDISGDGPNNQGGTVTDARDLAVASGITINGLPILAQAWTSGFGYGLDDYYRACVIGGPGAFVLPVTEWDEFAEAVRRKLVLELAGLKPDGGDTALPVVRAQFLDVVPDNVDCRIGEKQRRTYEFDR